MTMHERIMTGKLFTDMCEGMPAERLRGKQLMKQFNDSDPADVEERVRLLMPMQTQLPGSTAAMETVENGFLI